MFLLEAQPESKAALFVDRASLHWIVRDPEGNFWAVPPGEDAWENRRPFQLTAEMQIEPVPGHYLHMLGLPF